MFYCLKKYTKIILILTVSVPGLFLTNVLHAESLSISVSVDKTTMVENQQLVLTVDLSGEDAKKVDTPELPDMSEYLSFLGSGGTSQNIQIINGKMSVKKALTYFYMATKAGQYQIPPVKVNYKGKVYQSKPISITITKATASQAPNTQKSDGQSQGQTATDDLYVKALLSKKKVYQNEPVVVTYRIYTRVSLTGARMSKSSETAGFWVEEIDQEGQTQTRNEVINGRKYLVADIRKIVLFPTSPGKKTLGSLGVECEVRQSRRRSRDIFDNFFDDPFFSPTVQKTIYSPPVEINVLPLPETNKPADFNGSVGVYKLDVFVDKENVKTNEAISLSVKISGQGNIKVLPNPNVSIPSDFEQYEPKISQTINRQQTGISGSKTFEYVLVPRFPGQQRIKPISFSYFDTQKKQYRTLTSPEFAINVAKGENEIVSIGSGLSKEEVRILGQDIRFIKLGGPQFKPVGKSFKNSTLFLALLILPLLALAGSLGYKKHLNQLSENKAYARSHRANRMALKRLSKAKSLLNEKSQKEFYAEVSRSLLGFAADKLNLEEAGIISSDLEKRLRQNKLDEILLNEYLSLIQTCDYQRFAATTGSKNEMTDFYTSAKEAIIKLEKAI